ncbi:MAG: SGNH/GDSL hydrolase family protein [Marinilabiliaceae bacterium]|nr:SGNH/GDSL hydrolase family protein [Marinilabiliaceae bacterium]
MRYLFVSIFLLLISAGSLFSQADKELGLHSEGGPWKFYPATEVNDTLPKVLLIGDSVMNGYHQSVIDSLKGSVNVDYWLTPVHLKSEHLFTDLAKVVSFRDYDVIHFNIGLHGWPKGRIADDEYVPLLDKYVSTIKENSDHSRLIWASITPVTEREKAELNKEINPVIVERNGLAAGVMKKYHVSVNDLYGLVDDKLHLARGDRFHWKSGGYKLMGEQCISYITEGLNEYQTMPVLADYNVVWEAPGENSLGSMPAGNGDVGINLWVEKNGDLLFYLSKTDTWSENGRLLKIGKIRLSLSPNPFKEGKPFLQELIVADGMIHIDAGEKENKVSIEVWVDANHPVVEVDVNSKQPINARVSTEPWRTSRRKITNANELHSAYGLNGAGGPEVFVEKDTILENAKEGVIWCHRNKRSIWQDNLKLQGLGKSIKGNQDPLLNRTFGALIRSQELEKATPELLKTKDPLKTFSVSVYPLTSQTETLKEWRDQITENAVSIESISGDQRFSNHKNWWHSFWNRSYINVSTPNRKDSKQVFNVARAYTLQRYINACSGRGNSPIKFNGSIFTIDTENLNGQYNGFDADYRRWGGPYWWQNTRLPYWSMLEAGDYDLMQPLFRMYREALPIRKQATKTYYNHKGAFFPETMYFWGTYVDANYGRDRSELPLGMTENRYIRYYWQSGLEISLMMLDYYAFTDDSEFLKETLLPVVTEIINFYDQHWGRDENGKIHFEPAMALETYNTAVNPLPEIVGINKVCTELLKLPDALIKKSQQKQWNRLIGELPEIPTLVLDGKKMLAPAYEYSGKQNVENPELYAIFPYRAFGVGKDKLEMARQTFANRAFKQTGGWQQNAIKAAYLGLGDEAAKLTATNFNTSNKAYRFPTMWGPNYDWVPDQDHGSVAMIALQRMLVQYDGEKIYLLPAWPKEWDVQFKLLAPQNTTIKGEFRNGKIENLQVFPAERKKDIVY